MAEPARITTYDELGRAFANAIATASALGHVSAAGLADYIPPGQSEAVDLVVDAFAAARLDSRAKPAQARMDAWLHQSDLGRDTMRRCADFSATIG